MPQATPSCAAHPVDSCQAVFSEFRSGYVSSVLNLPDFWRQLSRPLPINSHRLFLDLFFKCATGNFTLCSTSCLKSSLSRCSFAIFLLPAHSFLLLRLPFSPAIHILSSWCPPPSCTLVPLPRLLQENTACNATAAWICHDQVAFHTLSAATSVKNGSWRPPCTPVLVRDAFQSSSSFFRNRKIIIIIQVSQPLTFFIFSRDKDQFTQQIVATCYAWLTVLSHVLLKLIALLRYRYASVDHEFMLEDIHSRVRPQVPEGLSCVLPCACSHSYSRPSVVLCFLEYGKRNELLKLRRRILLWMQYQQPCRRQGRSGFREDSQSRS